MKRIRNLLFQLLLLLLPAKVVLAQDIQTVLQFNRNSPVNKVAFSSDGKYLFCGYRIQHGFGTKLMTEMDNEISIWQTATGRKLGKIHYGFPNKLIDFCQGTSGEEIVLLMDNGDLMVVNFLRDSIVFGPLALGEHIDHIQSLPGEKKILYGERPDRFVFLDRENRIAELKLSDSTVKGKIEALFVNPYNGLIRFSLRNGRARELELPEYYEIDPERDQGKVRALKELKQDPSTTRFYWKNEILYPEAGLYLYSEKWDSVNRIIKKSMLVKGQFSDSKTALLHFPEYIVTGSAMGILSFFSHAGKALHGIDLHHAHIRSLATDPDRKYILAGTEKSDLILVERESKKVKWVVRSLRIPIIENMRYSSSGKTLFLQSDDGSLVAYDYSTGKPTKVFYKKNKEDEVEFSHFLPATNDSIAYFELRLPSRNGTAIKYGVFDVRKGSVFIREDRFVSKVEITFTSTQVKSPENQVELNANNQIVCRFGNDSLVWETGSQSPVTAIAIDSVHRLISVADNRLCYARSQSSL